MGLSGILLYMESPEKVSQILNDWEKEKKMSAELSTEVFNSILFKCNIKALQLAEDVSLPAHFRIPLIRPKSENSAKK